ncbi:MAG: SDR family oxidoreductase [Phycisphaerae bacterium]|jgi:2-deoxy-D-gluconate 3-dehydrogenase|nr:SDR family oxidoreductase [Phycisphaerae bacterium]
MDYPNFRLDDRVAVVTGASEGIGYGLAKALANAGAKVALAARNVDRLNELADEIRAEGGQAFPAPMDVCDVAQINDAMQGIRDHWGSLDILVNNAGIGLKDAAVDVTEAVWDEQMNVNLRGLFFCCQAAGKIMLDQGAGRIINMSSQVSVVGYRDYAVYCASKGGVNQLTKALALEWSARGVTVNAVGPTFIYTPGTAHLLDKPEVKESIMSRLPIERLGTITDVAGAVIYLASPAGGLVTGEILLVDGGWTAQ